MYTVGVQAYMEKKYVHTHPEAGKGYEQTNTNHPYCTVPSTVST